MRRRLFPLFLLLPVALYVGAANAELGWLNVDALHPNNYPFTLHYFNYNDHNWHYDYNVGGGWMAARWNGAHISPLFCVDIYSTFSIPAGWQANRQWVPPDPPSPPPFDTADLSYIYYNYANSWENDPDWAQAIQLAMWEISQEADPVNGYDWRHGYDSHTWMTSGNFQVAGGASAVYAHATEVLDGIQGGPLGGRHIWWYQPTSGYGQGLLGDDIPEPSSLCLLGVLIIGSAGVAWRKRR